MSCATTSTTDVKKYLRSTSRLSQYQYVSWYERSSSRARDALTPPVEASNAPVEPRSVGRFAPSRLLPTALAIVGRTAEEATVLPVVVVVMVAAVARPPSADS